jgi:hypothetical protein
LIIGVDDVAALCGRQRIARRNAGTDPLHRLGFAKAIGDGAEEKFAGVLAILWQAGVVDESMLEGISGGDKIVAGAPVRVGRVGRGLEALSPAFD